MYSRIFSTSYLIFLLTFILHAARTGSTEDNAFVQNDDVTRILDSIRRSYDKRVRPNYGGIPVVVGVTMQVISIASISDVDMDFTVNFYFHQTWKDPRLEFSGSKNIKTISVGKEFIETLWLPDTVFANEKKHSQTPTKFNDILRISPDGVVLRSSRLTVNAACPMNFQYFPMDRQLCTIEIESFGHTISEIRYQWDKGLMYDGVSQDASPPPFTILGYKQQILKITSSTGNFSRLTYEIQFVRSIGYYMIQIYIPSGFIVIVSWVSFWFKRNATLARVFVGVTAVLAIITVMSYTNAAVPKISYVKSIDVYLGVCFIMVFASLLESVTVDYMAYRMKLQKDTLQGVGNLDGAVNEAQETHEENPVYPIFALNKCCKKPYLIDIMDLDKYSRIIFPVCFMCFNLLYWIIYLQISNVEEDGLVRLKNTD